MQSIKVFSWIFWTTEYWCKAGKVQIWWTNIKPFFWKKRYLKLSPNFLPILQFFVLKSVKSLNWILGIFRKARLTLNLSKNFLTILELSINLFWKLWKVSVDCDYCFLQFFQYWISHYWMFNWRLCNILFLNSAFFIRDFVFRDIFIQYWV